MKIQCQVCESAEANVMCCADEAALCWSCDQKVHAANKLANKHQRVPLYTSSSSSTPKCDICQEAAGHFFCLEDRALLCRNCDVAIHTANPYVSGHQRFLLTGVKVGLESAESGPSSSTGKSPSAVKNFEPIAPTESKTNAPVSFYSQVNGVPSDVMPSKLPFSGGSATGSASEWQLDDFLGFMDFHQNDDYGSPKADSSKLVDSDCSPILRSTELDLERDECPGQVPESYSKVPEIPSPPTASGLHWQLDAFVPDITSSPASNPPRYRPRGMLKRRRKF